MFDLLIFFNTYLLSVDYVPDTLVGIEATVVNKIDKSTFMEFVFFWGLAINKIKLYGMSDGDKYHGVKWSREEERGPAILSKATRKGVRGCDILAKTCLIEDWWRWETRGSGLEIRDVVAGTWDAWNGDYGEYITAIREKEEKYTEIFHDLKNFMVSLGRKGLLTWNH